MSEIFTRASVGAVFVTLIIASIYFGHFSFSLLFGVVCVLALLEFYDLVEKGGASPQKYFGTLVGTSLFFVFAGKQYISSPLFHLLLLGILLFLFCLFIFELFRKQEHPFQNIGTTLLGVFYVAVPFSLLNIIAFDQEGIFAKNILVAVFILIWTNDTFAYLSGIVFGKHKLFERISPGKTWEGSIGGIILNIVAAVVTAYYFKELELFEWVGLSILISITATLGDLAESLLKRSIGVKDSGNIMPGHGGILDRFDAMLLSIPFVTVYLLLI